MVADGPESRSPVLTWADVVASDLCGMSDAAFDRIAAIRLAARTSRETRPLAAELATHDPLLRMPLR